MKENAATPVNAAPFIQIAPRLNSDPTDCDTAIPPSPGAVIENNNRQKKKSLPPLQSLQSMIKLNTQNHNATAEAAAAAKKTEQALLALPPILPKPVSMSGIEGFGCQATNNYANNKASNCDGRSTRKRRRSTRHSSNCSGISFDMNMLDVMSSNDDTGSLLHPSSLDGSRIMTTDLRMLRRLDKSEYRRQVHLKCEHRRRDAIANAMQSLRDAIARTHLTYSSVPLHGKDAPTKSTSRTRSIVDAESLSKMALIREAIRAISTMRRMRAELLVERNRLTELGGMPKNEMNGD